MTPADLIQNYLVVLQERHTQMLAALAKYEAALPELILQTQLPEPRVVARAAASFSQDLSTVAWAQEVSAPRASGAISVTVRIEMTVNLSGFHCTIRDLRSETHPVRYQRTRRDYSLPPLFIQLATALARDSGLPRERWDALIYTY